MITLKTVYTCGYEYERLVSDWFPNSIVDKLKNNSNGMSDGLVVFGRFGSCSDQSYSFWMDWLQSSWNGTTLLINGEGSKGAEFPDSFFQIGLTKDSRNSIFVPYVSIVLAFLIPETLWVSIFNHTHKPKNSGRHFCIYAHSNCVGYRQRAARLISFIAPITIGGRCSGQRRTRILSKYETIQYQHWEQNYLHFKDFKFCLVMENEVYDGYISEKILVAFLAGCIPIYYGTDIIFDIFNPDSFVFFNISNPKPALEQINELETNNVSYFKMMNNEKILLNGSSTIEKYFSLIGQIGGGKLKHKILKLINWDQI